RRPGPLPAQPLPARPGTEGMRTLLIVEDTEAFAERCAALALRARLEPFVAANAERAKGILREQDIHIALLDLMLPPSFTTEGLDLLRVIRQRYPAVRVVLMTQKDSGTVTPVAEAMQAGARAFLDKNESHFDDKLLAELGDLMSENRNRVFVSF